MEKKKILVLTSIYPADDIPSASTPVVHYFTKEWVKMGYDVRVINYVPDFPALMYAVLAPFQKMLSSKEGYTVRTYAVKDKEYELDSVKVARFVLKKYKPHSKFSETQLSKAYNKSVEYCDNNQFHPDFIISHWANPQLKMMSMLKEHYRAKSCYVAHGEGIPSAIYGEELFKLLQDVDVFGYRSDFIKREFEAKSQLQKPSFQCYSGIPEYYLENVTPKDFNNVRNYIYVGTLIKRKFPDKIVSALAEAYVKGDFDMTYIGAGTEDESIRKVAADCGVSEKVHLLGRISRDEVIRKMDENQVFVMVSKGEAFGLVYLEAMARGCITIASRKEGFDGIIQDGVNGFLCEAGNEKELAEIIAKIRQMPVEELQRISFAAMATVRELTDVKAAKTYIESVINL